jgi:hypothetical protein
MPNAARLNTDNAAISTAIRPIGLSTHSNIFLTMQAPVTDDYFLETRHNIS